MEQQKKTNRLLPLIAATSLFLSNTALAGADISFIPNKDKTISYTTIGK